MSVDLSTFSKKLAAPFPPSAVSWRVGSTKADKSQGLALAYIDARDVMERLDDVCGSANWQNKFSHASNKTVCDIGIKCGDEWVWKADGAGDTDVEAEKGALSDAFKRAAVKWGIGRYLYSLPTVWVALEKRGNSYVISKADQHKLDRALFTPEVVRNDLEKAVTKTETREAMSAMCREIEAHTSAFKLKEWAKENRPRKQALHPDFQDVVSTSYLDKLSELDKALAA